MDRRAMSRSSPLNVIFPLSWKRCPDAVSTSRETGAEIGMRFVERTCGAGAENLLIA